MAVVPALKNGFVLAAATVAEVAGGTSANGFAAGGLGCTTAAGTVVVFCGGTVRVAGAGVSLAPTSASNGFTLSVGDDTDKRVLLCGGTFPVSAGGATVANGFGLATVACGGAVTRELSKGLTGLVSSGGPVLVRAVEDGTGTSVPGESNGLPPLLLVAAVTGLGCWPALAGTCPNGLWAEAVALVLGSASNGFGVADTAFVG